MAFRRRKRRARRREGCRLFLNLQPYNLLIYLYKYTKGCRLQVTLKHRVEKCRIWVLWVYGSCVKKVCWVNLQPATWWQKALIKQDVTRLQV